jgi:hypothetical protein
MIKLFRNIRKKLLQEGKTANYFKYAIGEIVLVVIGILIALQINNWNQSQAERKVEKEYITSLLEDIATDTTNIQIAIKNNEIRIQYLDSLASICFNYSSEGMNDPKLYELYKISLRHPDFVTPTERTLAQLKNAGGMRLLKNKNSVNVIIDYEDYFKKLINQQVWYESMLSSLVEAGIPNFNYKFFPKTKEGYNQPFFKTAKIISEDRQAIIELGNRADTYSNITRGYVILLQQGKQKAIHVMQVLEDNFNIKNIE